MSGYVRATKLEGLEFEGEPVTGSIEQLSLPDFLRLQGTDVATDEAALILVAQILPAYVKDFVGPKAADGSPVTIEEVCSKVYFLRLVKAMGETLIGAARPPVKPSEPSAS